MPYRWLTSDEPEGQRLLAAAGVDATAVPLVVTPAGDHLVAPSLGDLAARVGLSTMPTTDFYDVVIVGGGPAGLGAAVYAASEGLRTVLVERRATGGQAGQSSRIENYLGFPDGVTGTQLTDRARRQAHKFGAEILTTRDVVGLDVRPSSRAVRFDDGGEVVAHTVLLATGISYRKLDVPGADALTGRGVFYGSAVTEAPACAGDEVYIIGGANSAGQAAVFLARHARRVTLLVRAEQPGAVDVALPIRQIADIPNIEVRLDTEVIGMEGDDHLEGLILCNRAERDAGDGEGGLPLRVHRRRAAYRMARRRRGARRQGLRAHRSGSDGATGADREGMEPRPRPVLPRGQRAGRVRRRRRSGQLGEASRVGGRRGRDGDPAHPRLPGAPMKQRPSGLSTDELRTLFLFEELKDDQLEWLAERGRVVEYPAGRDDPRRGRTGVLLPRAAVGHAGDVAAGAGRRARADPQRPPRLLHRRLQLLHHQRRTCRRCTRPPPGR